MKDDLDRLIDEAIAARRSAAALSARQQRELLVTQSFDEAFATELADAYARATPPEHTRKLYGKLFEQFRDWLRPDQVSALPAAGASVASYLIRQALDGKSLPKIKESASAIEWFHDCGGHYLDACYIQAAFAIIAKLNSDDGGGGEPIVHAPRTTTIAASEMPLAAGVA
jgi:hypothetical protein